MNEIHFLPPVKGVCPECGAKHAGGDHDTKSAIYRLKRRRRWREEKKNVKEWIDKKVLLPTSKDADIQGCVIVYHLFQGVMVLGWRQVLNNSLISHWMPMPPEPKDAKALRDAYNAELYEKYSKMIDRNGLT